MIEMSCPWMDNRSTKEAEKTVRSTVELVLLLLLELSTVMVGGISIEETMKLSLSDSDPDRC